MPTISCPEVTLPLLNRTVAGQALACRLSAYKNQPNTVVLALPRGGVPVAIEIASALGALLDVMVVRKLGAPAFPELALGAIASGNIRVFNHEVIHTYGITPQQIEMIARHEQTELERREQYYRAHRPLLNLSQKTVILVDDGIATGASLQAAIEALRLQKPKKIIVAVAVAAQATLQKFTHIVDEVVCLHSSEHFLSVSQWYDDFSPVSDEQVIQCLNAYWCNDSLQARA
ncbi:phosphoribosyltransferase [Thiomicrorhabdus aquaedulcis]|uniref:phosphoribosyltransferase n=1 Tax=Thiomicrorhabdus aquaedulcis TaxID=2211106 RepID=UPI000FD70DBF|nr:phosphoribosyltransferase [Thiomicrorhabdus aquaedulcis]